MEIVWYTVAAVVLYVVSDRILERIEIARGERMKNRSLVFFAILATLALASFWIIRLFLPGG